MSILRSLKSTRHGLGLWCLGALAVVAGACSSESTPDTSGDATPAWMQNDKTDDASVQKALSSKMAILVNLQTNKTTIYKDGRAVGQWKIASADVTGEFHNNEPQSTPTGIFVAEDMQVCPEWLPRSPTDPKTGKVAANEQERMAIIKANPDLFGPCGAKNPLGKYVVWFHGAYGTHGNAAEWILEIPDPEQRRVSGGCIRNPNNKIKDLFHQVVDTYPELSAFKPKVLAMEAAAGKDKKTLTQGLSKTDLKVVVGRWAKDPSLTQTPQPVTPDVAATAAPQPTATPVVPQKMKCVVSSINPDRGIVPVYLVLPAKFDNEHTFYSKGDSVTVLEPVAGTNLVKVTNGFVDKKYLSNCQIQN
ncbi:MAG: L,D-transpeptidase catalytic domain [Pseudomonadota bacterium]